MILSSASFLSAGKTSSSTIAAAPGIGEDVLERGVGVVEVEDDGLVVRRLDRALVQGDRAVLGGVRDAAEQVDGRAVGVLDLDRPLEAVLHVGGGQRVSVGELLVRVERARQRRGVVVGARLGGVARRSSSSWAAPSPASGTGCTRGSRTPGRRTPQGRARSPCRWCPGSTGHRLHWSSSCRRCCRFRRRRPTPLRARRRRARRRTAWFDPLVRLRNTYLAEGHPRG